ncbi:glutathione transferase omega-1 [Verticillium alfalfae VaMs.102]|uniref:Glutathione transferase omega-1 n=1 Tax=Verticillium alfalfae (strain VaMs.102 / ATCC MYA-4576 / FGSC 10136) TaxID=526221 RepID=C9SJL3_VERA1|nr:glutathione transferase omega-1 [Verticillium alfalfae VaMs.102]EEY19627.1 glutathione transferase omega-1 [Verticillium alfalfae VaMs.102]
MSNVDLSIPTHATGAAANFAAKHASNHDLAFYGGWFCPFVQRSWMVLHEKRIDHHYKEVNPYNKDPDGPNKEFLGLNPRGLIPTMAVPARDGGGKVRPLYDSTIVSEYLDEEYADESKHGPRLFPTDPYERARCRLWIDHINNKIVPGFYKFIQHTPEKTHSIDNARSEFLNHIRTLVREMHPSGPWFLGERFSMVDVMLAPWAMRLFLIDHYKPGGVGIPPPTKETGELETWSRWKTWFDAISERQSVKDTLSAREAYVASYKRYAEDTTNSLVAQATRSGGRMP